MHWGSGFLVGLLLWHWYCSFVTPRYRHFKLGGNPLPRFCLVIVAADEEMKGGDVRGMQIKFLGPALIVTTCVMP